MINITKRKIENLASKGYDKIAVSYSKAFRKNPNYILVLKKFMKKIPKNSKILDVGCGAGIPVSKFLCKRFNVIGIDVSSKMIKLAKKNVPKAKFRKMSMMNIKFKPNIFDIVCCFFALFHTKKSEIPKILKKFYSLLKKEGYLFLSLGESKEDKEHFSSFFGEKFYFTATPKRKIKKILEKIGFKILYFRYLTYKYKKNNKIVEDKELFIVAKKC